MIPRQPPLGSAGTMTNPAVLGPAVTHSSTTPDKSSEDGAFSSLSSSSSPRQYPTELSSPILEEGDETASESASPNEPVTPVSGRQSQDFHAVLNHDIHPIHHHPDAPSQLSLSLAASDASASASASTFNSTRPETETVPGHQAQQHQQHNQQPKPPLILNTAATPSPRPNSDPAAAPAPPAPLPAPTRSPADSLRRPATPTPNPSCPSAAPDQDPAGTPLQRRSTRGSTSSFKRTMSNLFRRSNSQSDKQAFGLTDPANVSSDPSLPDGQRKAPSRRWSMNKSSATTPRSNTPPSPGSPLEMAADRREQATTATVPGSDDFFNKKKNRASTGLNLGRRAVNFVSGTNGPSIGDARRARPPRRRASSFDYSNQMAPPPASTDPDNPSIAIDRSFWAMPADAGTGVKARRMSLSLPDDFTVDVAELQSEFEYQHKFLGRHGKHLGKGATSKVTLMARRGCPGELYAVKEFRGKSSSETHAEYEKKVKSEYSIAKSLHHPNIVETVRLCTDHGRWNHVMEYCSEGDLFSLVQKGYLKKEDREKDRLCFFKQLVQGVNYLHSNGIAHRDIKLENLLVTKDSKLKITDFGVSEVFSGIHPGLREAGGQCGRNMGDVRLCSPGICGSEPYIAPEVLSKGGHYDPRALDVWSSAIVMIHLIFGGAVWMRAEDTPNNAQYAALAKGWKKWNAKHGDTVDGITDMDYPAVAVFDQFVRPPALRRVLLQMLNPDPAKRISVAGVISNRWIKNIECCQLESYEDPAQSIDASKKGCLKLGAKKIFSHNHLPPVTHNSHSLGKMPGSAGY